MTDDIDEFVSLSGRPKAGSQWTWTNAVSNLKDLIFNYQNKSKMDLIEKSLVKLLLLFSLANIAILPRLKPVLVYLVGLLRTRRLRTRAISRDLLIVDLFLSNRRISKFLMYFYTVGSMWIPSQLEEGDEQCSCRINPII